MIDSEVGADLKTQRLFMSLATVPYLAIALLLVFAWHTSQQFGAWPSYGAPDPKDANGGLYVASGLAMLAAIPSVLALAVGLPAVRRQRISRVDLLIIGVGALGFVLLGTVLAGELGNWYVD